MKRAAALVLCLLMAAPAAAQVPQAFVNSRIGFTVTGVPDLATANGMSIRAYVDGATTGTVLSGLTCAAATAGGFDCVVNMPALVPGAHSLTLTAAIATAESQPSAPLSFVEIVITIGNPRIV